MENNSIFSNRLNELLNSRFPKKIKKIELAEKLYVTPQTVSRWCNGVIVPDRSTIELITHTINELYGFDSSSNERYRSEYLACEDNIPTYNWLSPKIAEYISQKNSEQDFQKRILPYLQSYMISLGYDASDINDMDFFLKFVTEHIRIAIKAYMDNINSIRKDGEQDG